MLNRFLNNIPSTRILLSFIPGAILAFIFVLDSDYSIYFKDRLHPQLVYFCEIIIVSVSILFLCLLFFWPTIMNEKGRILKTHYKKVLRHIDVIWIFVSLLSLISFMAFELNKKLTDERGLFEDNKLVIFKLWNKKEEAQKKACEFITRIDTSEQKPEVLKVLKTFNSICRENEKYTSPDFFNRPFKIQSCENSRSDTDNFIKQTGNNVQLIKSIRAIDDHCSYINFMLVQQDLLTKNRAAQSFFISIPNKDSTLWLTLLVLALCLRLVKGLSELVELHRLSY